MSILSAIARTLLQQEMRSRAEKKKHRFVIRNQHVGIEIICRGDWKDTHAPNFDLQLLSNRLGLCLSAFGYEAEQVRRAGGPQWIFADQNELVLQNRRNVEPAEEQKIWEDKEKLVLRAVYRADHQNTTFLYDFCLVGFKKKGKYLWLMLNGLPDHVWEHREFLDQVVKELVCHDEDVEPEFADKAPSLAERVGKSLGLEYQILPPQTSDEALVRIWKHAVRPGVQPLLLMPDECFLNTQPLPEYPEADTGGWPDAAAWLQKRLHEIKELYDGSEEDRAVWQEITAENPDKEIRNGSGSLYVHWREALDAGGLLLLLIPARHPWDVFRHIPFGGFNACPDNLEQMAVAKYWHEKYGACPIMLGRDTLQFYLERPPGEHDIHALACEMFGFCEDTIFQGEESVGNLEQTIRGANYWFFWWD